MAVLCDFCPTEKDGKFDLSEAKLAVFMFKMKDAPPYEHKAACTTHLEDAIYDTHPEGRLKFWTDYEVMEANDAGARSTPPD